MTDNIREEIEDKIIDWIALGADGRLVAFKPEKGADLIVQRKGDYPGKELSFFIKIFIEPSINKDFEGNILPEELKDQKNLYFLFVTFDEIKQEVEDKIWLAPAPDLIKDKISKFEAQKFSKYLMDKKSFSLFLIEKLISENKPKSKSGFKRKQY